MPQPTGVIAGIDTHHDLHHAAVITPSGHHLAQDAFPTTQAGYAALTAWLTGFGHLTAVGIEGTGSYGAGIAVHLASCGIPVIEVDRPDRRMRRRAGKTDTLDAYAAAQAVLAGRATGLPKAHTGLVEAIRALHTTRASAITTRTATSNQLRSLLITAPAKLRDALRGHTLAALVAACAALRSPSRPTDPTSATLLALRTLARRHQQLTAEITQLDRHLATLLAQAAPRLLALYGVGTETAAQLLSTAGDNPDRLRSEAAFAHLCGVAPIPASSGRTDRHRLNRAGDRQANRALHQIALTRLAHCPRTRAYRTRRRAQGKSNRDIIRCLKRYIAREVYHALTSHISHPHQPNQAA
jgi:transposase